MVVALVVQLDVDILRRGGGADQQELHIKGLALSGGETDGRLDEDFGYIFHLEYQMAEQTAAGGVETGEDPGIFRAGPVRIQLGRDLAGHIFPVELQFRDGAVLFGDEADVPGHVGAILDFALRRNLLDAGADGLRRVIHHQRVSEILPKNHPEGAERRLVFALFQLQFLFFVAFVSFFLGLVGFFPEAFQPEPPDEHAAGNQQ